MSTSSTSGGPLDPEWSYDPSLGPAPTLSVAPGVGALFAGRYEVTGHLGAGAMGVVFRARDREARREVALKLMTRREGNALVHFRREGQLLARVEHPHVLRIHDAGVERETPFLVLELVPGARTLDQHLARLGARERVVALAEAADGVGACHALGILHRDLKPQNILVGDDGRLRVTDFGLARAVEGSRVTQSGDLLGTPHYMSPEQLFGRHGEVGPAADVWALGVILHEALTGALPFPATTIHALAFALADAEPPPLQVEGAPPLLQATLTRALAKRPADRQADARALASDLRAVVAAWGQVAPPRRARGPVVAASLLVALGVAATLPWVTGPATPAVPAPSGGAGSAAGLERAEAVAAAGRAAEAVSLAGGPSVERSGAALALGHGHLALALARAVVADPRTARDPAAWRCLVAAGLWLDQGPALASALQALGDAPWSVPLRVRVEAALGDDPRGPIPDRAAAAVRREAEAYAALAGGWLHAGAQGLGAPLALPPTSPEAVAALPLDRDALGRALLAVARRDAAILRRLEPRGLEPAARRARAEAFARAALERSRPAGATASAAAACLSQLAAPIVRPRRPGRLLVDMVVRSFNKRLSRGGVKASPVLRWAAAKDPLNPRAAFVRAVTSGSVVELDAALRADPRLHGTDLPTFGKTLRGVQGLTSAVLARPDLGLFLEEFEPPTPARTAARAAALEAALREDPGDVLVIGALALLDLRLGRTALARERMATAAEAEPTWSAPRLYAAIAHMSGVSPDRDAARSALREAQRLGWPQVDASVYPELAPLVR